MVRRKIVWSHRANIRLFEILDFYAERNKSRAYSIKLYHKFNRELKLLTKFPELGLKTDVKSIRGLVVDGFVLFYESKPEEIVVHSVWDSRQNPDSLKIS